MTAWTTWRRWAQHPVTSALAVLVLFVVALGLGRVVTDHLSDSQASAAPFFVNGTASGGSVHIDYADVAVAGVRATDTLVSADEPETTTETFLVVDLEIRATERPFVVSGLRLEGEDGTVYRPSSSNRTGCADGASLSTGVTMYVMACFEIPTAAVPGAAVQVGRGDPDSELDRREQKAVIDLEIDAGRAAELVTADEPLPSFLPDMYPYDTEPLEVIE